MGEQPWLRNTLYSAHPVVPGGWYAHPLQD
nr:MAG TPA: hypothetical protein [Caudoviricetes sp.]